MGAEGFEPTPEESLISEWKPEEVFENNWAEEYKNRKDRFNDELLFLNQTVQILGELVDFRRDFPKPPRYDVVSNIIGAYLHASILSITRLGWDKDERSLPLSKFKQQISDNLKKDYKEVFDLETLTKPS